LERARGRILLTAPYEIQALAFVDHHGSGFEMKLSLGQQCRRNQGAHNQWRCRSVEVRIRKQK